MTGSTGLTAEQRQAVRDLAERGEDSRAKLLAAHPELASPEGVQHLCDEVLRLLQVDLETARRLARETRALAEELGDAPSRGRSARALANVAYLDGHHAEAIGHYERALELFDPAGEEREAVITRSSALHSLVFANRHEQAEEWAQQARETCRRLGDELLLARLEFNVGTVLSRQDRMHEALEKYRLAYEQFLAIGRPEDIAVALRNLAVCYISLNDFAKALQTYEQARVFSERHDFPLLVIENDYNIAYLYYLRGEYTRSLELFQAARGKAEELDDRYHQALCDLDQSEIYLELNLIEEAAQLADLACSSFRELGMGYEAAKGLTNLAVATSRQGKPFLALDLLAEAREMFVAEQNRLWPALIDLYRALVLDAEGRSFEAERFARAAVEAFSEAALPTKTSMGELLLARLELGRGGHEKASEVARRALERIEALDVPALEYQAHFLLGQIAEARGDRQEALASYRRSHQRLEALRSRLQTDELKIAFLEDKLVVYESLVALTLAEDESPESRRRAFGYIEKAKSRSLVDLLTFRAHALPAKSGGRSNLVERVRSLREELNWYYRQIDLTERAGADPADERVERLRRESRRQEERLLASLRDLRLADPEYSSVQEAVAVELAEVRAALPEGSQILEYYAARGTLYGCVVDAERLEVAPLTVLSRVRDLHRRLQFQLSKFQLGEGFVGEFSELIETATLEHLRALYDELIAPLEEHLDGERLIVVPHDSLHYLPFQALFDGERHLIDRFVLSYAPSASVFALCAAKPPGEGEGSLVLGVPDEAAPRIEAEARAVAEALPDARLLLGEEASQEALRHLGTSRRIVHLATHGLFRQDNPMFSALRLGGGRLSLFDLYQLRLEADLVTLSGCGTGLTVAQGADEQVGLVRGLLYAGARSVLVTLWDVHDESAAQLVSTFYRHLGNGGDRARALAEASRELRRSYPHPYHWAPFALIGDPG